MIETILLYLTGLFSDLRFDEARHMYFVNGENYPSVSKKLEGHYEKFIEEDWLPRCAIKEGVSESELKARWKLKNTIACDMGHDTHHYLEHHKQEQRFVGADIPQKIAGVQFLIDYIYNNPRYTIITQEFRMIHRLFKYCGTADMLIWDHLTQTIILADWKTNAEGLLKTYGYLKPPFDLMASNPFNKYQLQFNYYQLMVEQGIYKVSQRWLIYLSPEGEYTIHNTDDLTEPLAQYLSGEIAAPQELSYGMNW
jgi:hypothetical protein